MFLEWSAELSGSWPCDGNSIIITGNSIITLSGSSAVPWKVMDQEVRVAAYLKMINQSEEICGSVVKTNQRPVSRSRDYSGPIRGQYSHLPPLVLYLELPDAGGGLAPTEDCQERPVVEAGPGV